MKNQKYWEQSAKESNEAFMPLVETLGLQNVKFHTENQYHPFDVEFMYKGKQCICEIKKVKENYGYGRIETEGYYLEKKKIDAMLDCDAEKRLFVFLNSTEAIFIDVDTVNIEEYVVKSWPANSGPRKDEMVLKKVYAHPFEKSLKIFK